MSDCIFGVISVVIFFFLTVAHVIVVFVPTVIDVIASFFLDICDDLCIVTGTLVIGIAVLVGLCL